MRRVISVAVVLSVLTIAGGVISGTTTAQAASRSCTSFSTFENPYSVDGDTQKLPTVGFNTHDVDCVLGVGNQGDAVRVLQESLNTHLCYDAGLQPDGIYGTKTAAAVRAVQAYGGITQDGVYGPQTRTHMNWRTAFPDGKIICEVSLADI